ncbi:MAG: hypothetical protein IKX62_06070 [Bacteroidales bacterium]|nr:hypothetical protein [Bacteroidales bacterium]
MNLPTLIVLLLVVVALFFALRAYLRGRGRGSCGCESSGDSGGCSGCSLSSGCPYCRK